MNLAQALRAQLFRRAGYRASGALAADRAAGWSAAFVGAGGKSTAMFDLARELGRPVLLSTTTHLGAWQIQRADRHIIARTRADLEALDAKGVTLITGELDSSERALAVRADLLGALHQWSAGAGIPLLIEADGSHQKPLKAPAQHEPVIPDFADVVVTVAGLSGLGKPLSPEQVHRPDEFAKLSGLRPGMPISASGLLRVLTSERGGVKGIPPGAHRTLLLNQADTDTLRAQARGMVRTALSAFDCIIVASLLTSSVHAAYERAAGIVLAAGASKRYGRTKQLLDWRGEAFVHAVASKALAAGLAPVIIVTGAEASAVESAVQDLPIEIVRNPAWEAGQASSIQAGIRAVDGRVGAAVFLLADQPHISYDVIAALVDTHATELHPIVAPLVMMEQRANPVLFDRVTFPDLLQLEGDVGGRALFSQYPVEYMPWHDDRLLLDVDTEQDYRRLLEDDTL